MSSAPDPPAHDPRAPDPPAPLRLQVERIAVGGDGIARLPDGRIVFLDRGFPGDWVSARVTESRPRFARATVVAIISDHPPDPTTCPQAESCGGCRFQGAPHADELRWKTEALHGGLVRLAASVSWPAPTCIPSPSPFGWRHRVRLQVDDQGRTGYLRAGSHEFIHAPTCNVLHPAIEDARALLQPLLAQLAPVRELFLEWDPGQASVAALLSLKRPIPGNASTSLRMPEGVCDTISTIVLQHRSRREAILGDGLVQRPLPSAKGKLHLQEPVGSFSQAHHVLNETLRDLVHDWVFEARPRSVRVLDLFSGSANLSARLLASGASVVAIEGASGPLHAAARTLDGHAFRPIVHDLSRGLPPEDLGLSDPELVIVADPPRSGLSATLVEHIAQSACRRVVYVSCDPPHLARDAQRLAESGFRVTRLAFLDMFPRSAHLEALACLERC